MQLTEASQRDRSAHQAILLDLEAKKRAFQVDVPTLPGDVRDALRRLGEPVRIFGENLANVRDRLRMELAKRQIQEEKGITKMESLSNMDVDRPHSRMTVEEEQVTKYSRASPELIQAREKMSRFSLTKAKERLSKERNYRIQFQRKRIKMTSVDETVTVDPEDYIEITRLDDECSRIYKSLRNMGLEGSQYGDARPISSIAASQVPLAPGADGGQMMVATGSWSGTIKLWNGSTPELNSIGEKTMAHEDRIMGLAIRKSTGTESTILATASIDLTAKLWKVTPNDAVVDVVDDSAGDNKEGDAIMNTIHDVAHLKGHAARLCSVAFHPQGDYVATTSFDHTWRLWDVETGGEVLLQDGHWKEVYGIGFHPDGSLCSTTDYGGVVQVWDLRNGKSICHFLGHAKRVVCTEFSPNGFQLATAGDDGTIKIWDLRKRKQYASIPAHSNLITQLRFDQYHNGEFLASSSFDGTAKIWSTRDWKMLSSLRGHEGKLMGVDLLPNSVVTCGFDKTLKLWR